MKLAIVGIIIMIASLAFASGLVANPLVEYMSEDEDNYFMPVAEYPKDDPADTVYHSEWTQVDNNTFFVEWTYIWAEQGDSETVRVYVRNNTLCKLQFYVLNQWVDIERFPTDEGHPIVKFMAYNHNAYITTADYAKNIFKTSIPFLLPFLFGVLLVVIDLRVIEMFARYDIARGVITGTKKKK